MASILTIGQKNKKQTGTDLGKEVIIVLLGYYFMKLVLLFYEIYLQISAYK